MDEMNGTPFGRYRLVELLGRGGMGEVWRAYDPTMDRVIALKALPPNFADNQVFQERFRREARAAAGLDEPHVVPLSVLGTPVKVGSVGCLGCLSSFRSVLARGGPQSGAKVERPQRSEDERP